MAKTPQRNLSQGDIGTLTKFSADIVQLSGGLTATLQADITTAGAGGLDTGTVAADTLYYVHTITDGGVAKIIISLSATTPTGFDSGRVVAAFYTDDSSEIGGISNDGENIGWTDYTPTVGAGLGTATNIVGKYRRVGDTADVVLSVTAGTVAASALSFTIPPVGTIDFTKIGTNEDRQFLGMGHRINTNSGITFSDASELQYAFSDGSDTTTIFFAKASDGVDAHAKVNGNTVVATGDTYTVRFSVPITGWGSKLF